MEEAAAIVFQDFKMENKDEISRKLLDKAIKKNRCKFIYRAHLLPSIMEEISNTGSIALPAGVRAMLEALITPDQKLRCRGEGVMCRGHDAQYVPIILELTRGGNTYKLEAQWRDLFQRNNIRAFAVIRIWVCEGMNEPEFYFRLDGHANEGEASPPILNMDDGQEFSVDNELLCGRNCAIS